jgi:hypothetical protein
MRYGYPLIDCSIRSFDMGSWSFVCFSIISAALDNRELQHDSVLHMNNYSCFHNYAESQKVELQFGNVRQGPRKAMRESNTVAYQT